MKQSMKSISYLIFYREPASVKVGSFRFSIPRTKAGFSPILWECTKRGVVFLGLVPLSFVDEVFNSLKLYVHE